jgi:hypothetical protein
MICITAVPHRKVSRVFSFSLVDRGNGQTKSFVSSSLEERQKRKKNPDYGSNE